MKYYAEITLNNKPKNKAEEACQNLAIGYNHFLINSELDKQELVKELKHQVAKINRDNHRCGDVPVSTWSGTSIFKSGDVIENKWLNASYFNMNFANSTTLTFKPIKQELKTL